MDLIDIILAVNRGNGSNGVTLPIVHIETPLNLGETVIPESDPAYDTLQKAFSSNGLPLPMIAIFQIVEMGTIITVFSRYEDQYVGNIEAFEDGHLCVFNFVLAMTAPDVTSGKYSIVANVQFGAIPMVAE